MSFLHQKVFDPILNSKDAPANIISGGNMNKIKLLELRKCRGQYNVIVNNILSYKGGCGVWVMYDNHNQLLEVAQTSDVYEELEYDLSWLMKDYSNELNLRKKYTARRLFDFNAKFDVLECDKNRTTAKYRNIAENSEAIVVYLVVEERATSKEKNIREEIELEIAIDNQALYWNAYGSQRKLAKNYYKQRKQIA